jgi:hypothetical protein
MRPATPVQPFRRCPVLAPNQRQVTLVGSTMEAMVNHTRGGPMNRAGDPGTSAVSSCGARKLSVCRSNRGHEREESVRHVVALYLQRCLVLLAGVADVPQLG